MENIDEVRRPPFPLTGGNAQQIGGHRDSTGPPRPPPRNDRYTGKQPMGEGSEIEPLPLGFDRILARLDRLECRKDSSDRRVENLERPLIRDLEFADEDYDSDDREYGEYRDEGFGHRQENPRHRPLVNRDSRPPARGRRGGFGYRGDLGRDREPLRHHNRMSSWDSPTTRQRYGRDRRNPTCWDPPRNREYNFRNRREDNHGGVKMRAPHFDGTDATNWVSRAEYYFDHMRIPEEERLHYAVMLFDPPTDEWIFNYRHNNRFVTWDEFVEDVRHRFDPQSFRNYIGPLAKLVQTGTVADYHDQFEKYLNRVEGLSDYSLIPIFIEGLKQPIQEKVELQQPQSLAEAMALALRLAANQEHHATPATSAQKRQWQPRESKQQ